MGGVKIKGSLSSNQEDVVCSNIHHSFLDGLPTGIWSPAWGVCGKGNFWSLYTLLLSIRTQEPFHFITVNKKTGNNPFMLALWQLLRSGFTSIIVMFKAPLWGKLTWGCPPAESWSKEYQMQWRGVHPCRWLQQCSRCLLHYETDWKARLEGSLHRSQETRPGCLQGGLNRKKSFHF